MQQLQLLYRTKLALLATIFTVVGIALLLLARWSATTDAWRWLANLPVTDIGSAFFTSGLIVIAFEYIAQEDAEVRANQRLRKVLREEAPAIRDAVVDGFAFAPDNLTSMASSKTLDRIVENCLTIQLGDPALARDVYTDLREQVRRTAERRFDVHVSVSLSPWADGPAAGRDAMFVATIRWNYRTRLLNPVQRFACVSDLDEYRDLLRDPTSAGVWYFEPIAGLNAGSSKAFELVQFMIDGRAQPIRHAKRVSGQVYTVNADAQATQTDEVQVSATYRLLVQRHSHLLYLDFDKPCKGVKVDLWYGDAGIRYVNVLDPIAGAKPARAQRSPKNVPKPSVSVGYDGWVFPRSSVAFVWVLEDEMATTA